jgi:hypothetical protein
VKKNLSTNNDLLVQNGYEPPAIVMNTAATSVNESDPLQYYWDADDVTDEYYLYLHFNEVEELTASDTRAFNITVNDKFWYGPVIPKYGAVFSVFSTGPLTQAARYNVTLSKTEDSTLPPILNALEIYKIKDFSESETE